MPDPDVLSDDELARLEREAAGRCGTFWEDMRRLLAEIRRLRAREDTRRLLAEVRRLRVPGPHP